MSSIKRDPESFFFFLLRSWQIEILLSLFLYRAKKLTISLILFTKKTLSTSLILAKCRTGLIYELRNESCSPRILCGSVVEHENFFFVLSSLQDEKRRYQRYRLFSKLPVRLFLTLNPLTPEVIHK